MKWYPFSFASLGCLSQRIRGPGIKQDFFENPGDVGERTRKDGGRDDCPVWHFWHCWLSEGRLYIDAQVWEDVDLDYPPPSRPTTTCATLRFSRKRPEYCPQSFLLTFPLQITTTNSMANLKVIHNLLNGEWLETLAITSKTLLSWLYLV